MSRWTPAGVGTVPDLYLDPALALAPEFDPDGELAAVVAAMRRDAQVLTRVRRVDLRSLSDFLG
jgi:hypothetical protein